MIDENPEEFKDKKDSIEESKSTVPSWPNLFPMEAQEDGRYEDLIINARSATPIPIEPEPRVIIKERIIYRDRNWMAILPVFGGLSMLVLAGSVVYIIIINLQAIVNVIIGFVAVIVFVGFLLAMA